MGFSITDRTSSALVYYACPWGHLGEKYKSHSELTLSLRNILSEHDQL